MLWARNIERWQLTDRSLRCLLQALHSEEAEAVKRYGRLQQRLTFFFMRHRSVFPEDLADQVINRVAAVLTEGRPIENIEAYSLGVGRMVLREEHARLHQENTSYQEAARNSLHVSRTSGEDEAELEAMEAQVAVLAPPVREMLEQYHRGRGRQRIQGRQDLARSMGISAGTLRKRVFDLQALLRRRWQNSPFAQPEAGRES